ncbi:winged helix DNA-binding domain-containing protein [Ornithinimicrobium sp. Arc0846-15]|nr:winged helix DNA-binding domain-containing protein [Ornithinimicrobium laminariae]
MTVLEDVARMRLISQRLIQPLNTPTDVVRHMTCTQGQDLPGSTCSIALRTTSRSLAEVHEAYNQGLIVRSWPMRGTLFAVAAEDLGWMLEFTAPKIIHSTKRRREQLGLDDPQIELAEAIAREALESGPLTRAELMHEWTKGGHNIDGGRGYHSIFLLAVKNVICLGPFQGKEQCFVLSQDWINPQRALGAEETVREWLTRYIVSHGPVPLADFLWWTKLLKRDIADIAGTLRDEFETFTVNGREHWVWPQVLDEYADLRRKTTAPMLLPGFDEIVLGYGDRSAVATKGQEKQIVPGSNGVFRPTIVQAGKALGTWKKPTHKNAPVSVTPFADALPAAIVNALPALTQALPK